MHAAALNHLVQLRERQRDAARMALAVAQAAERRFDEQRRGWRRVVAAEAATSLDDPHAFGRWLDGRRTNEVRGAEHARELARRVRAAAEVERRADLGVEQMRCLARDAEQRERRAADAKVQRELDDFWRGERPADAHV